MVAVRPSYIKDARFLKVKISLKSLSQLQHVTFRNYIFGQQPALLPGKT
jgi:hypothetical protein